jgi:nicotinamidase-related amidase
MEPLRIVPAESALVVVDLQKGVVGVPTEPHPAAVVVQNAARLAAAMREAGGLVVLVRVAFSSDQKDMLRPIVDPGAPTIAGARSPDFAELVPELTGHAEDHLITKRQWGAFHETELDLQLRRRRIGCIILCGVSTSIGVESTARGAFERGYQQIFAEDAMSSRSAAEHAHTVTRIFPRLGRVRSTEEILSALGR